MPATAATSAPPVVALMRKPAEMEVTAREVEVALPSDALPLFVMLVVKRFPTVAAVEEENGITEAVVEVETRLPARKMLP